MPPRGWKSPKVPNPTRKPTKLEVAWAAGFIEGEGSFKLQVKCPRVSAGQVNKEPLLILQAIFGGSLKQYKNAKPSWSPLWYWYVNGARAREVIATILPWLSQKRKQQARRIL